MANLDLKATLELIDKMSAPLKAISSQASKMQKDIASSTKELQKMQSTLNKANNLSGLTDKLRQVQQEIKKVAAEEKALQRAISASGVPTKTQTRDLAKLSATLAQLQQKQAGYRAKMGELGRGIQEAGFSSKNLAHTQAELAARMNTATAAITRQRTELARLSSASKKAQATKDLADKMQGGGMRAATAGAGALYGLSKPLNEAKKFETETARVASLGLGQASTDEAVKYAKAMKTFGTSTLDNLQLVRDGMTAFADEHHAQMVAPTLAKMKFANEAMYGEAQGHENERKFMDMLKVIEVRGGLKSDEAFKEQASQIQQVITATGGRVGGSEWMNAIKTGGIAAKSMDNKAFYYMLEPLVQEMGGHSVGTGLMSAYQNLYQGKTTKRAAGNLDKMGLIGDKSKVHYDKVGQTASFDIGAIKNSQEYKANPYEWMKSTLLPALAAKGITEKAQVLDAIGSIFSNRKGADFFANMYLQKDQIEKSIKFNQGADNIDQLNEKAQGTAAGKELEAKAKMHDAYLQLGTAILPTYTAAIEAATSAMQGMATVMEEYPTLTKGIAIGLAIIAAAFVVFGGLAVIIGSILGPLAMLKLSISTLGGMAGIISGLGAAFSGIVSIFTFVGSAVVAAVTTIGGALMRLVPIIRIVGMAFMANPILAIVGLIAAAAIYIWMNWETLGPKFAALWASITAGASAMWQSIVSSASAMMSYVAAIPSQIVGFFSSLGGQMMTIGGQIMDGLKNGIMSRASAVMSGIQEIAGKIKSTFTSMMGIHSPSRVFASYGDFMMQGLHQGLVANDSPVQAVIRTSDNIRSAMDTSSIRFDRRPPIRSGLATTGANTAPAPITINVYASAGQSVKDIARQVASELARTGQAQTANNTALYDLPEQWG